MSVYKNESLGTEIKNKTFWVSHFGDWGKIKTDNILYNYYFMIGAKLKRITYYIKICYFMVGVK